MRQTLDAFVAGLPAYLAMPARVLLILLMAGIALRLRDYSGNVHYVPNGNISVVTNKSLGFAYAVVDAGIAYGEDIDRAVAVMRRIGDALRQDAAFAGRIIEPIEIAGVENLGESAVVIRCRFKVVPLEQWNVRREYLRRLKMAFDENGIEIPFRHVKLVMPTAKE